VTLALAAGLLVVPARPAAADGPTLHSAGSTWVQIALTQWASDVARFGLNVDYQGIGSTAGRQNYMYNLIDFAATEIPYQPDELAQYRAELGGRFPHVAVPAGRRRRHRVHVQPRGPATGQRITNLRLTSGTVAKIFTGKINRWRDPAVLADNPASTSPTPR
jgi:phosphate transport system substrate-binding protein